MLFLIIYRIIPCNLKTQGGLVPLLAKCRLLSPIPLIRAPLFAPLLRFVDRTYGKSFYSGKSFIV